ncbi:MAG TPA: hypothetical protein EYN66_04160 [Myxococcales bacterium]|nr:hypothetical protein [Myxococcales bacterium]
MTVSVLFGMLFLNAERQYALHAVRLAEETHVRAGRVGGFTGEWSFRWAMEQKGWQFDPEARLLPHARALNAAPLLGPVGAPQAVLTGPLVSPRLLDSENDVGFYAETLGFWPITLDAGPIEQVELW